MARPKIINEVPLEALGKYFVPAGEDLVLRLKVKTESSQEKLSMTSEGLSISVRALAIDNAANLRVLELLARLFGVPTSKLEIISGHKSRLKRILFKKQLLKDLLR